MPRVHHGHTEIDVAAFVIVGMRFNDAHRREAAAFQPLPQVRQCSCVRPSRARRHGPGTRVDPPGIPCSAPSGRASVLGTTACCPVTCDRKGAGEQAPERPPLHASRPADSDAGPQASGTRCVMTGRAVWSSGGPDPDRAVRSTSFASWIGATLRGRSRSGRRRPARTMGEVQAHAHESTRACAGAGGLETQTCSEGARGYNAVPPAASVAFEPGPADSNVGVARAGVGPSETSSLMLSALSVQRPEGFPGSGMQVQSAGGGFPAAHRRRRDLDQRRELGHRHPHCSRRSATISPVGTNPWASPARSLGVRRRRASVGPGGRYVSVFLT